MINLAGQSLGRYQNLELLGEGGMAIVYKALDTRLERTVAIKVIRTERLTIETTGRTLKRFEREAKVLARLIHANIVQISDYGEYEGHPYLVMPYFAGGTLKELLGKPIPWKRAFKIILPIAHALEYAHSQGIIHRDVKPSNILMTASGDPLLSDFGVAKILTDTEETLDLTGTGAGVGTPEYMAPEQFQGKVTPATDIYSLGVILYEMIVGRKPFTADTPAGIIVKQASDPLPRPKQFIRNLPTVIEKILYKALAKSADQRFKSMTELADVLEKTLIGEPKNNRSRGQDVPNNFNNQPKKARASTPNILSEEAEKAKASTGGRRTLIFLSLTIVIALFGIIITTSNNHLRKAAPVVEATKTIPKTETKKGFLFSSTPQNTSTYTPSPTLTKSPSPTFTITETATPLVLPAPSNLYVTLTYYDGNWVRTPICIIDASFSYPSVKNVLFDIDIYNTSTNKHYPLGRSYEKNGIYHVSSGVYYNNIVLEGQSINFSIRAYVTRNGDTIFSEKTVWNNALCYNQKPGGN